MNNDSLLPGLAVVMGDDVTARCCRGANRVEAVRVVQVPVESADPAVSSGFGAVFRAALLCSAHRKVLGFAA